MLFDNVYPGPKNAIVYVSHSVLIDIPQVKLNQTHIYQWAVLDIADTKHHDFGTVFGDGIIKTSIGTLPKGNFTDFNSENGGTLWFYDKDNNNPSSYPILASIPQVNNLKVSGTGRKELLNTSDFSLQILGDFEIDGNFSNLTNGPIYLKGNLHYVSGDLKLGTSDEAQLIFNGSSQQVVEGLAFKDEHSMYNVTIDNPAGVKFNTDVHVLSGITFKQGILDTKDGLVTVESTNGNAVNGFSNTSYVDGPFKKRINSGSDFTFPLGNNSYLGELTIRETESEGAEYFTAQYYHKKHDEWNASKLPPMLQTDDNKEYWEVSSSSDNCKAYVETAWNEHSSDNTIDPTLVRQVLYNGIDGIWELSGTNPVSSAILFPTVLCLSPHRLPHTQLPSMPITNTTG